MSTFMDTAMFPFAIFLIFNLPLNVLSQLPPNAVTLGSSLTANNNATNNSWTSPSGDFALGFIQSPGGYLLAIWFNKIPEKTVVWSANRDNLAQQGSRLQLSQDGSFVLNDQTGKSIWAPSNTAGIGVAYGVMLDTGNFVLRSNTSTTSWQSFDTPTDTLLPTQKLLTNGMIVPNLLATNYSSGRFQLSMQGDGNLVLYTRNYPLSAQNTAYWTTQISGNNFQLVFNQSGTISVVALNGTFITSVFSNTVSSNLYYQRLTLDYDGVLRQYVYPKSSSSTGGRPMAWSVLQFLPQNICASINQNTGGGVCGYNSVCSIAIDQKPTCTCPTGYSLVVPNDSMSGCKPDFMPQSCDNDLNDTANFGYDDRLNTAWPQNNYEDFSSVTEDWCRQNCLSDCFCAGAVFKDAECRKKRFPLSNGQTDASVGWKAMIKVRQHNFTTISPLTDTRSNHNNKKVNSIVIIVGSSLLGSSVLVNILLLLAAIFFGRWFSRNSGNTHVTHYPMVLPGLNIRSFSYKELEEATNGFKEELGRGAFSVVYKGSIEHDGMRLVAVKQLHSLENQSDDEFNAEVRSISKTNHKNLVQLLGYCNEGQHRLLVYEYMCNGSLASYLFDSNLKPNWYKRVEIAFTTARGLCYLHEECSLQIIHCDIKPQNVLLDESLNAKISDFGVAKMLKQDQTKTTTGIRGTRGYVAPEWFRNMAITSKVDVYSFGVLLLEIVCCRKNVDSSVEDEKEVILTDWAYDCYEEGKLKLLINDDEEAQNDMTRVERFVSIAIWCIQEDPSLRPTMKRVVQMLEGSISVSVPPSPSSFISSIS